ncbi:MAG TPA: response regulator, partial [Clostridia bacterium]|nr:response regulator [Clostridia bacterium]
MLLRMVIADDEDVILDGLREIVDWNAIGFEVAGCFRDGQSLLNALHSGLSVDAILSDIRMEGTSGIDIAQYVHDRQLPTKVVLLSGYRDFEYARQAIGYGVSGYLTKPCAISEIQSMFAALHAQILREKQSAQQADRMRTDVAAIREALHAWIGKSLLQGDGRLRGLAAQA